MQNFNNYPSYPNYNAFGYTQPKNEYAFVDGIEAARAYQVRPNSMMLLMDSNKPLCYKKQVDSMGRTIALEMYELVPYQEKPPVEYVTKQEFEELKAMINKEVNNNA